MATNHHVSPTRCLGWQTILQMLQVLWYLQIKLLITALIMDLVWYWSSLAGAHHGSESVLLQFSVLVARLVFRVLLQVLGLLHTL
jgi:hypothetical protein